MTKTTTPLGERPLADCLSDYWRGDFTLRDDASGESGPDGQPPAEPAVARLGASGLTVRGRDLALLLEPAYRIFAS